MLAIFDNLHTAIFISNSLVTKKKSLRSSSGRSVRSPKLDLSLRSWAHAANLSRTVKLNQNQPLNRNALSDALLAFRNIHFGCALCGTHR